MATDKIKGMSIKFSHNEIPPLIEFGPPHCILGNKEIVGQRKSLSHIVDNGRTLGKNYRTMLEHRDFLFGV